MERLPVLNLELLHQRKFFSTRRTDGKVHSPNVREFGRQRNAADEVILLQVDNQVHAFRIVVAPGLA